MSIKQNHKGIQIQKELFKFIKYMDSVENYREELMALTSSWDNLTIMGQLGHTNIDMESTKNSFAKLTEELLNHLAMETLKKIVREMTAKAQISVDMVIRNLFERTADIGFLATDDDIRYFLQNTKSKYDTTYEKNVTYLKNRFEEYVKKYSVYFDIILMDTKGNILVNLIDNLELKQSKDEVVNLVLNTSDDYVETYKYHDFTPQYKKTLVYSYKVTQTNEPDSPIIGVLSLCFRFTDEMKGIFQNLINPSTQESLTILDNKGSVIASSDKYHIPLEATLELVLNDMYKVVSFGGRYYLSKTCSTNGYQDFMGLGWYGHIMVPIEHAFTHIQEDSLRIKESILQAILQYGDGFSNELKEIPKNAMHIQNNLNRAVWNGNISQSKDTTVDTGFSRLLLSEVAKTGDKTKNIFNSSIINLTKTMILNDTVSIASLMIDIMDRNLYERANDCRWWALTSEFRTILDNDILMQEDKDKLCSILAYINELYTVYTNLFIYDKNGVIVAVSNTDQNSIIGKSISNSWAQNTLRLNDSSQYEVSDFEQSALYDNRHTYIYNASIKSASSNKISGGIGIVFDSEIELKSMILESLPRYVTGELKNGVFGVFTTKNKMIISSSNDKYNVGLILDIDDKFFNLKNGESHSEIITLNGKFYSLGVKCSDGYREYKSFTDNYSNDVYSFFFSYISEADIPIIENSSKYNNPQSILLEDCDDCKEIATFYIGKKYLGVYVEDVLEAVNIKELESSIVLDDNSYFKGTIIYKKTVVSVLDIKPFIKEDSKSKYKDIVIVNYEGSSQDHYIGLLVDDLDNIIDVSAKSIQPLENHLISGGGSLVESIVSKEDPLNPGNLLTLLNIKKLGEDLTK